jgi:hypothetical protein
VTVTTVPAASDVVLVLTVRLTVGVTGGVPPDVVGVKATPFIVAARGAVYKVTTVLLIAMVVLKPAASVYFIRLLPPVLPLPEETYNSAPVPDLFAAIP